MGDPYYGLIGGKKNLVFLGEAGCGKSEIALNFAARLAAATTRPVHFFDLDQTKPVFRSRDVREKIERAGVGFHFAEQFLDSPTIAGGVEECLMDEDGYAILDVGGGEAGARMIGRFARLLNDHSTMVFYIVNPYRPWSRNTLAVDGTLGAILRASRIQAVHGLGNPALGSATTAAEFLAGLRKTRELLSDYPPLKAACVREALYDGIKEAAGLPVLPLNLYLKYEWIDE